MTWSVETCYRASAKDSSKDISHLKQTQKNAKFSELLDEKYFTVTDTHCHKP